MTHNVFLHRMTGTSTFAQAVENLREYDAWKGMAPSVRAHLSKAGPAEETLKRAEYESWNTRVFMVNPPSHDHVKAAMTRAGELGHAAKRLYDGSGVEATHNVSMNDLTVVLVLGTDA